MYKQTDRQFQKETIDAIRKAAEMREEFDFVLPPEEWVAEPFTVQDENNWADKKLQATEWVQKHKNVLTQGKPVILVVADTAAKWNFDSKKYTLPQYAFNATGTTDEDDHGHSHMIDSTAVSDQYGVWNELFKIGAAKVVVMKCMSRGGGRFSWIAAAYRQVLELAKQLPDHQIVVNSSFGAVGASNTEIDAIMDEGIEKHGIVWVASMGNSGRNPDRDMGGYPAISEYAIGVGAVGQDNKIKGYSSQSRSMEVVSYSGMIGYTHTGAIGKFEGTSFSSPLFACLVAFLLKANLTRPDLIRTAVRTRSIDLGKPGWDDLYGHGLITKESWETEEPPKEEPPKEEPEPPKQEPKVIKLTGVRVRAGDHHIDWKRSGEQDYKKAFLHEIVFDYEGPLTEDQFLLEIAQFVQDFAQRGRRKVGIPQTWDTPRAYWAIALFLSYYMRGKRLPGKLTIDRIFCLDNRNVGFDVNVDFKRVSEHGTITTTTE